MLDQLRVSCGSLTAMVLQKPGMFYPTLEATLTSMTRSSACNAVEHVKLISWSWYVMRRLHNRFQVITRGPLVVTYPLHLNQQRGNSTPILAVSVMLQHGGLRSCYDIALPSRLCFCRSGLPILVQGRRLLLRSPPLFPC